MLCEGQTCCVGAGLVVFASHLHFYTSVWEWVFLLLQSPKGFHYILSAFTALLCLLGNEKKQYLSSGSQLLIYISIALPRKRRCLFSLSVSVYICPQGWGPVTHIKCLCWLIIREHLNKLQCDPWHFYWRQLTADVTNVFLSGAIMTIKVSSGTWDQCLMMNLHPVAETVEDLSVLYEVIVLSGWATEAEDTDASLPCEIANSMD